MTAPVARDVLSNHLRLFGWSTVRLPVLVCILPVDLLTRRTHRVVEADG
eukprot:COSAG06_NODE_37922_length_429_cov_1.100000_2_plen_48_part_01